jgi:hypothetical protein
LNLLLCRGNGIVDYLLQGPDDFPRPAHFVLVHVLGTGLVAEKDGISDVLQQNLPEKQFAQCDGIFGSPNDP